MIQVWRKKTLQLFWEMISVDRFPEAFGRFEEVVDVRRIQSFRQLRLASNT